LEGLDLGGHRRITPTTVEQAVEIGLTGVQRAVRRVNYIQLLLPGPIRTGGSPWHLAGFLPLAWQAGHALVTHPQLQPSHHLSLAYQFRQEVKRKKGAKTTDAL
jgi:hypothetical protein